MDSVQILAQLIDGTNTTPEGERAASIRAHLATLTDVDLGAVEHAAVAEFDRLHGDDSQTTDWSSEDVNRMGVLADIVDAIRAHSAYQERQERVTDLTTRITAPPPAPEQAGDPGEDTGDPEETGTAGDAELPSAQPGPAGQADAVTTVEEEEAAVTASTPRRPVPLASLPNNAPSAVTSGLRRARYQVLAAADIPGISAGAALDGLGSVTDATIRRFQALGRIGPRKTAQAGIAVIRREGFPVARDENDWRVLDEVCDEHQLPGGSLIASAGWCSPSDQVYDLCGPSATTDGMVDVPTITLARGGLRYPTTPDFSAIYGAIYATDPQNKPTGGGFHFTETELMTDVTKPVFDIPCVDWKEIRLDVIGLAIRSGILQDRAYPEVTKFFVANALTAHAHRVNAYILKGMAELATPLDLTGAATGPGYLTSMLSAIELQVEWYRYHYRLAQNATLEMVAPQWMLGTLRADLSRRMGVDMITVPDAAIIAHFTARGVQPQFVYDWQDALADVSANGNQPSMGFGSGTGATSWPADVDVLLYPAGTFFVGQSDVITMDGIYDSTLLEQNQFMRLFTEEGICVGSRECFVPLNLKLPICPIGESGPLAMSKTTAPGCAI